VQIGLIGMPFSGKTTLFNLLTGNLHPTGVSGTGEVHIGSAVVPDERIDYLSALYKPKKTTYARIDFKDIPGIKMNDSKARAAQMLDEVRSADALVQVLRVFDNCDVETVAGNPEPFRDLTNYRTELLLADIDSLEKKIINLENSTKAVKENSKRINLYKKILIALENENPVSSVDLTGEEKELLSGHSFLSEKPLFLVVNIDEEQLRTGDYPDRELINKYTGEHNIPLVEICTLAEMEIGRLEPEEQSVFLEDLGLNESGLGQLARMTYDSLNLISFFTVGEDEVKAWSIRRGTSARKAAGKIHSDIERGFIRAEVFHYDFLQQLGSTAKVREAGHFRLEGKDYPVKDGDIINFRFNV
jgi:hypothetical protein